MVYIAGRYHGAHGEGCPAISYSKDNGVTFSPPRILKEFGPEQDYSCSGNASIGATREGAIVVLAMGFTGDEKNSIFGWRSEDDGATWSAVDASSLAENKTGSTYGNIITLPDGRLTVFGHFRKGSATHQQGIWQSFSSDDGRSWEPARRITEQDLVEPAFIRAGGRLIGLIRDNSKRLHATYIGAVSDDDGKTWTFTQDAIQSKDPSRFRLPSPFLAEDPQQPGRLLGAVTERCSPNSAPGEISLWSASVDERKWFRGPTLVTFPYREGDPNTDFGYPWMLPLNDGRWLMVFYAGEKAGPNAIWKTAISSP